MSVKISSNNYIGIMRQYLGNILRCYGLVIKYEQTTSLWVSTNRHFFIDTKPNVFVIMMRINEEI